MPQFWNVPSVPRYSSHIFESRRTSQKLNKGILKSPLGQKRFLVSLPSFFCTSACSKSMFLLSSAFKKKNHTQSLFVYGFDSKIQSRLKKIISTNSLLSSFLIRSPPLTTSAGLGDLVGLLVVSCKQKG